MTRLLTTTAVLLALTGTAPAQPAYYDQNLGDRIITFSADGKEVANRPMTTPSTERQPPPQDQIRRPQQSYSEQEQTLRSLCANEWPQDFAMRAYCEKRQRRGLQDLASSSVPAMTQQLCAMEWPRDFAMRAYCEKRQMNGLRELQRAH